MPVAIHAIVSWYLVRDLGPLIDHMRQTVGFGTLDLPIYNLAAQNEGGPDLTRSVAEGRSTGSRFLSWV